MVLLQTCSGPKKNETFGKAPPPWDYDLCAIGQAEPVIWSTSREVNRVLTSSGLLAVITVPSV